MLRESSAEGFEAAGPYVRFCLIRRCLTSKAQPPVSAAQARNATENENEGQGSARCRTWRRIITSAQKRSRDTNEVNVAFSWRSMPPNETAQPPGRLRRR